MSASLSSSEDNIFLALHSFLTTALPATTTGSGTAAPIHVIRTEINRVPEPDTVDWVAMTPILRERLSTNTVIYSDGYPNNPTIQQITQPTKVTIQLDVHGPASANNAQIISTLLRSGYGVYQFAQQNLGVIPLYTSDPHQSVFDNGEDQMEIRWTIDAVFQTNQTVTVSQDFASTVVVGLIEVDAVYPP